MKEIIKSYGGTALVSLIVIAAVAVAARKSAFVRNCKQYSYRSFMPWPENEQRLALASRLGLNVSEILNEALEQRFDDILKIKASTLEKQARTLNEEMKKMVRGAGFEPATPTVSR